MELINRVTDKESLSLCAIKTLAERLSKAYKATMINICVEGYWQKQPYQTRKSYGEATSKYSLVKYISSYCKY